MGDLETAARRLRDSVAALGRPDGTHPWSERDGVIRVANDDLDWPVTRDAGPVVLPKALAEHIALTGSPPTVALVAGLLEAVAALDERFSFTLQAVDLAADAVASAILNDQHEGSSKA